MRFKLLLGAIVVAAIATACESVPDVTFADPDASTPLDATVPGDGAVAGDASSIDGGGSGTDGGTPKDSGSGADGGTPVTDAAACDGGAGDICCGADLCHNCLQTDCATCTGLGCNGGNICCKKGPNLSCKAPGPGC